MSRPSALIPGDTLCYKKHDLLGDLIAWGEWTNGRENTDYVHVALVFDDKRLIRQNPGGPAFEDLDAQDWINIDVYRLKGQPEDMASFEGALEKARLAHWTEGYAYTEFGDYIFSDLEARLGAMTDAVERRKVANRMMVNHTSVCSVFACQEVLQDALGKNLFPWLGPGQLRPSDIPLCQDMYRMGNGI